MLFKNSLFNGNVGINTNNCYYERTTRETQDENITKRKEELQKYFDSITSNPMITQDPLCSQIIYAFFRRNLQRVSPNVVFGEYYEKIVEKVKKLAIPFGPISENEMNAIMTLTSQVSKGYSDSVFQNIDQIKGLEHFLGNSLDNTPSKSDEDDLDDLYLIVNSSPKDSFDDEEKGKTTIKNKKKMAPEPKSMWFNMPIENSITPSSSNESLNGSSPRNTPIFSNVGSIFSMDWNSVIADLCQAMNNYNKAVQYPRMMMYKECCEIYEKLRQERELALILIFNKMQKLFSQKNQKFPEQSKACKNCLSALAQNCVDMTLTFEEISESFALLKKYFSELATKNPATQRKDFTDNLESLKEILQILLEQVKKGQQKITTLRQILKTLFVVFDDFSTRKLSAFSQSQNSQTSNASTTSSNATGDNDMDEPFPVSSEDSNSYNVLCREYIETYLLPFASMGYVSELSFMVPDALKYFIIYNCSLREKRIRRILASSQKSDSDSNLMDSQMKQAMEKLFSEKIPQTDETRDAIARAFQSELQSLGNSEIMDPEVLLFCIPEPLHRTCTLFSMRFLSWVNQLEEIEGFQFCRLLHVQYSRTTQQELEQWNHMVHMCRKILDILEQAVLCFSEHSQDTITTDLKISITYETKSRLDLISKQFSGYAERLHYYNSESKRFRLL